MWRILFAFFKIACEKSGNQRDYELTGHEQGRLRVPPTTRCRQSAGTTRQPSKHF